jgi:hypothetical protein
LAHVQQLAIFIRINYINDDIELMQEWTEIE